MERRNVTYSLDSAGNTDRACPVCGSMNIDTHWRHDDYTYGSGESAVTLPVHLPVRNCNSCAFEYLDHEAESLYHNAVCQHLGVLNPKEVRDIRYRLGMSRASFANITGLGAATLARWENGSVIQNRANDRYLRLLATPGIIGQLKRLVDDLEARVTNPIAEADDQFPELIISPELLSEQASFQLCPRV